MSPIVELTIRKSPLFADLFAAVPGLTAELESAHYFVESGGHHYALFWWVWGCEFDEFERVASDHRHVRELDPLTALDGRRLYRVTTTPLPEEKMLFPYFRRNNITMLDNESSGEGFWLRLRVPDHDALEALVGKLHDLDTAPEVERIYLPECDCDDGELTEKQREALRLAAARGYFETPSEVTLDALATDLDITAQSLSQHIRAGVRKLIEAEVGSPANPVDGSRFDGEA
ncbi:helix-turn-helix domain-containing protein [Halosimplex pelagicum]|uniref:Helix-turn-helix domain-containing protein n=1 Tax=Halosimplex pelagicum TaxID=869886 RepID=A0A7D5T9M2_9EURY|nr:helix-turn-helix domain-containing protein [Halosimplex pelagicum]QLH80629.1 helix-turn-helix domain-containing protein [Halosimplex pelagicum]